MPKLVAENIATLVPYSPGKPIAEVKRELGVQDCIKLASNENPIGPSPLAMEAIARALPELNFYPDGGFFYLKGALAERFAFEPREIMVGNGSNELIELVMRVLLSTPGHNVVTSTGTFAIYRLVAIALGEELREAPLGADYGYDLDAMLELVDENTAVIVIANPNNPTGTYVSAAELDRFAAAIDERYPEDPPYLILDEAYYEYALATDYPDGAELLRRRPNTVVLRTFSKAYGLAGLRCGYGFASPELVDWVNRIRAPFNVNSLAQVGALAALDDHGHVRRALDVNREGMAFLGPELEARGVAVVPSQANFLLVDCHRDAMPIFQALMAHGVIVRPMGGLGLPTAFRLTVGARADNERFLGAFDEVMAL